MALTDERTGVNEPPRDEKLGKMTLVIVRGNCVAPRSK